MVRVAVAGAMALAILTPVAAADNPPPPGPSPSFSSQPIAPLRDGSNYWPGYLLANSGAWGVQIKACYIVAPKADLGGSNIKVPSNNPDVYLLCSNSEKLYSPCPKVDVPVCGTKDEKQKSYDNDCEAWRDDATNVRPGECQGLPCPDIDVPVCGTKDGKSKPYKNDCEAWRDGATSVKLGKC